MAGTATPSLCVAAAGFSCSATARFWPPRLADSLYGNSAGCRLTLSTGLAATTGSKTSPPWHLIQRGVAARAMHHRAMTLLQHELSEQLLRDGGHQERSASYHLLMLDRLVELGELLQARCHACPSWLLQAVARMAAWATAIEMEGSSFPRFNDSAADACRPLSSVILSAQSFLAPASLQRPRPDHQPRVALIDLPDTGWSLLRPGHGWELAFKCGVLVLLSPRSLPFRSTELRSLPSWTSSDR